MHQTIAFRTALMITRSEADAEEAAQDAFVKAHAALGRFREGAPFRPWLLAIVANEARNRLRSAGRRGGLALRVAEERRPDDAVPSPEAALLDSERRERLLAAIERLPDPARRGDRLPLPARSLGGGDGSGARLPARDREVAPLASPRQAACGARRGGAGVSELESRLTQLGRELDWPATPELAPAVTRRIREAESPAPGPRRHRRLLPPAGFRRSLAIAVVVAPRARRRRLCRRAGRARFRARLLRPSGGDRRAAPGAAARASAGPAEARPAHHARGGARVARVRPARA